MPFAYVGIMLVGRAIVVIASFLSVRHATELV